MDRSQMWALRCRHEAATWTHNAFLTLTYDDKHLPWHGSLDRDEPRLFIRYLRRHLTGEEEVPDGSGRRPIRFFGCGEYGSQRGRPHYHFLLFNVRFPDLARYGRDTCTSKLVSKLWSVGTHQIVPRIEAGSAAYVAGYAQKKVSAWDKERKYGTFDPETGEYVERVPEFPMMSLKPAIGQFWYDKYKEDLRNGYIVADGKQVGIPRIYRDKLKSDNPVLYEEMEFRRYQRAAQFDPADRSEERLAVRKEVVTSRRSFFKKSHLED